MSLSLFECIKQQVSILDVVQEYVALKPAGNYWKGPSPFKAERVPSFTVTPSRGIYYCFSTATGGDVIDFIARIENCSPIDAAWYLVKRYNLTVPDSISKTMSGASFHAEGQRYEQVCDFFSKWCMRQLTLHARAREYVSERGLSDLTTLFGIGYCPGGSRGMQELFAAGRVHGLLQQDFEAAQLIRSRAHGQYNLFDDRIVFTIFSAQGRACGFGGRVFLPGDERPKYVNSQDHDFFSKRALLYGFSHAKKSIQERGFVYLVEGYIDCLAMVRHGYPNTVATLGTACSLEHLQLLSRHAQKVYLVYDGDEAGQRAMMRLVTVCWQANLEPYVITFPPADDPASYLAREGSLDSSEMAPRPLFDFFVERLGRSFLRKPLAQKLEATRQVVEAVLSLNDPLQRTMLLQRAAETFGIPMELLHQQYKTHARSVQQHSESIKGEQRSPALGEQVVLSIFEKRILFAILKYGSSIFSQEAALLPLVLGARALTVYQCLLEYPELTEVVDTFPAEYRPDIITVIAEGETVGEVVVSALRDEIHRKAWMVQLSECKRELAQAQAVGDQERVVRALEELQRIKGRMLSRGNG